MAERLTTEALDVLLRAGDYDAVGRHLATLDPADVADYIESIRSEDAEHIFQRLSPEQASDVLVEMEPYDADELVDFLSPVALAEMINEMASDDAVDIFSGLDQDEQDELLPLINEEQRKSIKKLMGYEEDSAGGLMTPELCAVAGEASVQEAINAIAAQEFDDPITVVFAHDRQLRLIGYISIAELLTKPRTAKISEIVNPDPLCVKVDEDQEEIANMFRKYDLYVIPVVDEEHHLVGRITADDVMDVMQEEADEDLARIAGAPDIEHNVDSPVRIARLRFPWLLITMFTGLVISGIIRKLTGLTSVEGLAAFVPVIMAMGGNTGMQASAVTIRGIALGEIQFDQLLRRSLREIMIGVMMGFACGLIAGLLVWVDLHFTGGMASRSPLSMAATVAFSMCLAMTFAALCGTFIPLILHRLRIDPALASGPFVTTGNDLSAALIYFATCYFLLKL